jgi:3-isopropylmalate/(R)-2-methylmalate dehydratase small subunit
MIRGRVWKFPANTNTDLILPAPYLRRPVAEQARAAFSTSRPGWADQVQPGDIIVAGSNFGTGSSRPAARSLRHLGIACVMADSINGLFFRNSVNYGLLALNAPGVSDLFAEGQAAEIDLASMSIRNVDTGGVVAAESIPGRLLELMREGGIFPALEKRGLIGPMKQGADEPRSVAVMNFQGVKVK